MLKTVKFSIFASMKRCSLIILSLFLVAIVSFAQWNKISEGDLKDGDILFVVNTKGNAITAVTTGLNNLPIDHAAICYGDFHRPSHYVIQAAYRGVEITPLDTFMVEAVSDGSKEPLVLVGRLNVPFDFQATYRNAVSYLFRPYDYYFDASDDEIYCSELILQSYVDTNGDKIFKPIPMTFRDSDGNIPQYWTQYYARRGLPVPEGAPGSNPAELSRRKQITILGCIQSSNFQTSKK